MVVLRQRDRIPFSVQIYDSKYEMELRQMVEKLNARR